MNSKNNIRMIGGKGRVYLPPALMQEMGVAEGTVVQILAFNGAAVLIPMELRPACDPFADYDGRLADHLNNMTATELYTLVAAATAKLQEKMDKD